MWLSADSTQTSPLLAYIDDDPVGEEGRDRDGSSKKGFSLVVTETDFRPCDVEVWPLPPASVLFLPPLQKGSGEEKQAGSMEAC